METKNNESLEQESPLDVVEDFTSGDTLSPVVSMEKTFLDKKLSMMDITSPVGSLDSLTRFLLWGI